MKPIREEYSSWRVIFLHLLLVIRLECSNPLSWSYSIPIILESTRAKIDRMVYDSIVSFCLLLAFTIMGNCLAMHHVDFATVIYHWVSESKSRLLWLSVWLHCARNHCLCCFFISGNLRVKTLVDGRCQVAWPISRPYPNGFKHQQLNRRKT